MKVILSSGEVIGNLTTIKVIGKRGFIEIWLCRCSCGKEVEATKGDLTRFRDKPRAKTMSCGCARGKSVFEGRQQAGLNIHNGLSTSPAYDIWRGMIRRCTIKKAKAFQNYGGRGIKVCDRWLHSFENFLADMGQPPFASTIERIDNGGNYQPDNCKWGTRMEQGANTRKNRMLTAFGKTQHIAAWAREYNLSPGTITHRIDELKWTEEKAISHPPLK